jgi:dipeptidyl aminopeptidase/acylaminoacyl peptidase
LEFNGVSTFNRHSDVTVLAERFVTLLIEGSTETAWEMFDDNVKSEISVEALSETAQQITDEISGFIGIESVFESTAAQGDITAVTAHVAHKNAEYRSEFTIAFDGALICDLSINLAANPDFIANPSGKIYSVETVTIGKGGDYPLFGILTMPSDAPKGERLPAVVLVHGSGPQDMNETTMKLKPFADIADYLSDNGIAVLRYYKRTYTYAVQMAEEFGAGMTVFEETIEDALHAKALLEADPRINPDRIFVIGHSLGGYLAPEIAEKGDFAGLVALAPPSRPMPEIIMDQISYLVELQKEGVDPESYMFVELEDLLLSTRKDYETFKKTLEMTDDETKEIIIFGNSAYYYKDIAARTPIEILSRIDKPSLILQGSMDYQVLANKDFVAYQELSENEENVNCVLYDGLTHFFVPSRSESELGMPLDYGYPEKVDELVLSEMLEFIRMAKMP